MFKNDTKIKPSMTKKKSSSRRATFSVDEAAKYLGLGRVATYEAVRKGEIPAVRVGKRWLVPKAALEKMLLEGKHVVAS
jgi:excisionase family DNA binding protein